MVFFNPLMILSVYATAYPERAILVVQAPILPIGILKKEPQLSI